MTAPYLYQTLSTSTELNSPAYSVHSASTLIRNSSSSSVTSTSTVVRQSGSSTQDRNIGRKSFSPRTPTWSAARYHFSWNILPVPSAVDSIATGLPALIACNVPVNISPAFFGSLLAILPSSDTCNRCSVSPRKLVATCICEPLVKPMALVLLLASPISSNPLLESLRLVQAVSSFFNSLADSTSPYDCIPTSILS